LAGSEWQAGGYARFLKRQLSLPVSMMSQWCVSRSSMAVVILASPNTCGQWRRPIVVKNDRGVPVLLKHVARVELASEERRGMAAEAFISRTRMVTCLR
jgi:hypothetical protein